MEYTSLISADCKNSTGISTVKILLIRYLQQISGQFEKTLFDLFVQLIILRFQWAYFRSSASGSRQYHKLPKRFRFLLHLSHRSFRG